MGFWQSTKDWLGGGTSKKPWDDDFKPPPLEHQGQIDEAIRRGLGTNNTAPQTAMGGQFRDAQTQQLGQLQRIASGQEKGAGELAAQRQVQTAAAGQQAMARMARGSNAGQAMRAAANNTAAIGLSGAGQAQEAAMRDQQAAQGLLTQAASAGRGQDQAVQLANMDAQLKTMGMNDQARLAYLQQLTGMDMTQLQLRMNAYNTAQQKPGALGPLLSAGGAVGAAAVSDERLKVDIEDADEEIDEMLDRLVAKRYRYKDEAMHGKGTRPGVIAQDLMRSKAGSEIVRTDPDGMMAIDTTKAVSAALASLARINKRLRAVEGHEEDEKEEDEKHEMGMAHRMGPRPPGIMIIRRALEAR